MAHACNGHSKNGVIEVTKDTWRNYNPKHLKHSEKHRLKIQKAYNPPKKNNNIKGITPN